LTDDELLNMDIPSNRELVKQKIQGNWIYQSKDELDHILKSNEE
jgi:hypothetical protein